MIIGHRFWVACDHGLRGPFTGTLWPARGPVSQNKIGDHAGVFAAKTAKQVSDYLSVPSVKKYLNDTWFPANPAEWHGPEHATTFIVGTVALWGEMAEHKHGWRAQYGKIHTLDYATINAVVDRVEAAAVLADLRKYYAV